MRSADEEIIAELQDIVSNIQDLLVLTPYPDMEEEHVALISWARIDKFPVAEFTEERVRDYIEVHMRRFNPDPEGF